LFLHSLDGLIEAVRSEPQHDTVAVSLALRMANVTMLVSVPTVELHHHTPIRHELFVIAAAVPAFKTENRLIPGARCDNVLGGYERL
jgi:hypothetical protein